MYLEIPDVKEAHTSCQVWNTDWRSGASTEDGVRKGKSRAGRNIT